VRDRVHQAEIIRAPNDLEGTGVEHIRVTIDTRVPDGGTARFKLASGETQAPPRSWFKRWFGRR
jgi:hypothetical protein